MFHKTDVFPPADIIARFGFTVGRSVTDRSVGNRQIVFRRKFQKRGIKRQNFFAFRACAFGKNYHAFAVFDFFNDFISGSRNVAAIAAIDKNRAHIAHHPSGKKPIFDVGFGDENRFDNGAKSGNISVAQMI